MRLGSVRFLFLVGLLSVSASAAPLLWTLSGVTFADGGTASGSYIYDATTNTYSSVHVITTAGSRLPGATYTQENVNFTPNAAALFFVTGTGNLTGTRCSTSLLCLG